MVLSKPRPLQAALAQTAILEQIKVEPKVVILINSIANGAYNNNGPVLPGMNFTKCFGTSQAVFG